MVDALDKLSEADRSILASDDEGLPGFARRLNFLMGEYRFVGEDGQLRKFTNRLLADALADVIGTTAESHISNLRTSKARNPGGRLLAGLCLVFDVPPSYWFVQQVADEVNLKIAQQSAALAEQVNSP